MRFNGANKSLLLLLGCMSVLSIAMLRPQRAEAQVVYIKGPLAGAPTVKNLRLYREGRVHIKPHFGFSLQDEYTRTIGVGLTVQYHIWDWLGIGAWGMFSMFNPTTNLTDETERAGQTTDRNALSLPTRSQFSDQVGVINWAGALQVTWIPLRGKLALLQKLFVDTDFYVFAGAGGVGVEERANVPEGVCQGAPIDASDPQDAACLASQTERASRVAIAPTFGAGFSAYINEWAGLFIEWRGLPFAWNRSGTDERGLDGSGNESSGGGFPDGEIDADDRIFRFNHFITLGATFAFPTAQKVQP